MIFEGGKGGEGKGGFLRELQQVKCRMRLSIFKLF